MSLSRDLASSPEMLALFSDEAMLAALGRFEAELAKSEGEHGVIPESSASIIAETALAAEYDLAALAAEARKAGPFSIPYVAAVRRQVARRDAGAAAFVHYGSTSQDLLDTALVLQLAAGQEILDRDLVSLIARVAALAEKHADTVILGRTLLQPAQPVTLGVKLGHWALILTDARRDIARAAAQAFTLQLGGAAGTLALIGDRAEAVTRSLAGRLGLGLPPAPWQSRRDGLARYGAALATLCGGLGKIARDLTLAMQAEVGELVEGARGGSSAMPHKRNPVGSVIAASAAVRAPGLAASLLAGLTANELERGIGGWQSERPLLEDLLLITHGSIVAMASALDGLVVDPARIEANLAATHGLYASEAAMALLGARIGRSEAARVIEEASQACLAADITFVNALRRLPGISGQLSEPEWRNLATPAALIGSSKQFAADLLTASQPEKSPRLAFLDRGGRLVHYRIDGASWLPPLILGNSLGTDLSLWDGVAARLSGRFRIIRFDLPGHGLSDGASAPLSVDDIADDVIALMDGEGIARADYAGVSVAGLIGQSLLIRYGARLGQVTLCCAAARMGTPQGWEDRIALIEREGMAAASIVIAERWFSPYTNEHSPALVETWRRRLAATPPQGYIGICHALAAADMSGNLAGIDGKVTCLAGRDDRAVALAAIEALAAGIRGAKLVVLDRVGHLPSLEAPDELASLLLPRGE